MRNKSRTLAIAAVFALVALVAYFALRPVGEAQGTHLRVGYLPITPALPLFVAVEQGYFRDEGLNVELVKHQNGALLAEGVATNRLAAASPGPADVYLKTEQESPGRFQIYLQTAYTPGNFIYSLLAATSSEIRQVSDLRGKTIAVFPGVTNKILLELALKERFGWRLDDDIHIIGVAPQLQLDGLLAGEFDALCPLEPLGTLGASRDGIRMVEEGVVERSVLSPLYITAHALSAQAFEEQPDTMAAFVRAMYRAVEYIREHESEARRVLVKYTSLNARQAVDAPLGLMTMPSEADRLQFQRLADVLHEHGVLEHRVMVDPLYYAAHR